MYRCFFTYKKFSLLGSCIAVFLLIASLSSCYSIKNIAYFQDLVDSSKTQIPVNDSSIQVRLKPYDLVGIDVISTDPAVAAPFNVGNTSAIANYTGSQQAIATTGTMPSASLPRATPNGWRVDSLGNIQFPLLGQLHVEGMTCLELKDELKKKIDGPYIKNPIIQVQLLNFTVTFLGENGNRSSLVMEEGKNTLLNALGIVGGASDFADLRKIMVIRSEKGQAHVAHLDLTSSKVFNSPYYYLKQNDIVYITPRKEKAVNTDVIASRWIGYVSSLLGVLGFIIAIAR